MLNRLGKQEQAHASKYKTKIDLHYSTSRLIGMSNSLKNSLDLDRSKKISESILRISDPNIIQI